MNRVHESRVLKWLSATSFLYFFSPLSVALIPHAFRSPRFFKLVLGIFAISQILPVILGENPLNGLVYTTFRVLLVTAMLTAGYFLREWSWSKIVAPGIACNLIVAVVYSITTSGLSIFHDKLLHPILTSISLGLYSAVLILIGLFDSRSQMQRVAFIIFGFICLMLSGSRSAMLACAVGIFLTYCSFYLRNIKQRLFSLTLVLSSVILMPIIVYYLFSARMSINTSERDIIWFHSINLLDKITTGLGSYQIGRFTTFAQDCQNFVSYNGHADSCPKIALLLHNAQLIAHNIFLQQFAEAGIAGLIVYAGIISLGIYGSLQGGPTIIFSVIVAIIVFSLNDNGDIVPGPLFSSLFWIAIGNSIGKIDVNRSSIILMLASWSAALMLCALNIFVIALPNPYSQKLSINDVFLPSRARIGETINGYVSVSGENGDYRIVVDACQRHCVTLNTVSFRILRGSATIKIGSQLKSSELTAFDTIKLMIYPAKSNYSAMPLNIVERSIEYYEK